jgi:hypothetical protein
MADEPDVALKRRTIDSTTGSEHTMADEPEVALKRRTIDTILIASGAVLTVALIVAGALLTWGSNFAGDYVDDELSSQNVVFPAADALQEEGRDDLAKYADEAVNTGSEAEAYASYINGHLQGVADGATYADLGGVQFGLEDDLEAAETSGASDSEVTDIQGQLDEVTGQRDTLFKGETLRGLLLTAFAWGTVGRIAGYAAIGAFVAGAIMLVLTLLGLRHHHKVVAPV